MKKISVIVPCYNSAQTITKVVDEVTELLGNSVYTFQIILTNDSSSDNTFEVLTELSNKNPFIISLNLSKNFGQHAAIMAAINYADGDYFVFLDDDGQTPPSAILDLIEPLNGTFDVVYAKYKSKHHSMWRNLGSKINDVMSEFLIGKPRDISISSFFATKKYVIDEIKKYKNPYPYLYGLIFRTTNNITNVVVKHQDRADGHSGYNMKKLFSLWINGFTSFSIKPLRIATLVGAIIAFGGFIYAVFIVISKLRNPAMPAGYSSTLSILLFIGGLIMLMLGMIGEYIGRIYISINNSPQYVIKNFNNAIKMDKAHDDTEE